MLPMRWIRAFAVLFLLVAPPSLLPQRPPLEPAQPEKPPTVPTVTFTFDWASIQPSRYVIAVESGGRAAYQSSTSEPAASQPGGEPYMLKFTVSRSTRDRVFALAQELGYFQGNFDFRKHNVAFTGTKVLAYADPVRRHQTQYNWSENPGIQELTALFEGISTTLEFGRRLERLIRYDRLGLDAELKRMEELARNHSLPEVHAITPVLQRISADPAFMHIARQRAQSLLRLAEAENAAP